MSMHTSPVPPRRNSVDTQHDSTHVDPKVPKGLGEGVDTHSSGGTPPPQPGFMDLIYSMFKQGVALFKEFHRLVFFCPPSDRSESSQESKQIEIFLNKWFPETITFYIKNSRDATRQVMIEDLQKLNSEDFKLILRAYNKVATPIDVDATTPKTFIGGLKENVTLNREDLKDELIHPYGLHKRDLKTDLSQLDSDLQKVLQSYAGEKSLVDHFFDNRNQLRAILASFST